MPGLNRGNNSRQRGVPLPALALGWSVAGALISISSLGDVGLGCPFCLAVSSTLTADLAQSSAAAVAACESRGVTRQGHSASMNLRIIEVFKGDHRKLVGKK